MLFGRPFLVLPGGGSLVLLLVALTSVTYLAWTLFPALTELPFTRRSLPNALESPRLVRALGFGVSTGALLSAAAGLRVGAMGHGAELVPSLALAVAASAALGGAAALAALGAGKAARSLASARIARTEAADEARKERTVERVQAKLAFTMGDDLIEARDDAEEGLARLGEALGALESTGAEVDARLEALDDAARAGDLGQDLRRTRDEVGAKLELGRRIHTAAEAAAFRLACNVPVRKLLRTRPEDLAPGLEGARGLDEAKETLDYASTVIDVFLSEVARARAELDEVAERRPVGVEGEDPWAQAVRDIDAVAEAYRALRDRIGVSALRLSARAGMDAVASAAGEVLHKARASGIPARTSPRWSTR